MKWSLKFKKNQGRSGIAHLAKAVAGAWSYVSKSPHQRMEETR